MAMVEQSPARLCSLRPRSAVRPRSVKPRSVRPRCGHGGTKFCETVL